LTQIKAVWPAFVLGILLERRLGGPLKAKQLNGGDAGTAIDEIEIVAVQTN
jgi:hypothetical protein